MRSAWATTSTSATATACARPCSGHPTGTRASAGPSSPRSASCRTSSPSTRTASSGSSWSTRLLDGRLDLDLGELAVLAHPHAGGGEGVEPGLHVGVVALLGRAREESLDVLTDAAD